MSNKGTDMTREYTLRCGGMEDSGPELAKFSIGAADAEWIIRMATFVRENDLHKVERFDYRVTWLDTDPEDFDEADQPEPEPVRTECDCINVSGTDFWFTCYPKHSDHKTETEQADVAALAQHFGIHYTQS